MSNKSMIWLGAIVGGTIGGFIPGLWGGSEFGGWSILLSTAGGIVGIWLAYRYIHS